MNSKDKVQILGVNIGTSSEAVILEQIIKGLTARKRFVHVVSLNPEILVLATKDPQFSKIISEAEISINDGIGTVLASYILNSVFVPRTTGVDLMQKLIKVSSMKSLRVLLLGGKSNLAETLADCYNQAHPGSKYQGLTGFKNINDPKPEEEARINSIVASLRPHLLFVAFGSPEQEKWIYRNRASLQGVTCIGVGGAFDFIGGKVRRAPGLIQNLGLEWLYRLILQPWRWRRQLRLVEFIWLVLKQRFSKKG